MPYKLGPIGETPCQYQSKVILSQSRVVSPSQLTKTKQRQIQRVRISLSLSAAAAGGQVWPSFLTGSKESEKKSKIEIQIQIQRVRETQN